MTAPNATERIAGYSAALLEVAHAEGLQSQVERELEGFAQVLRRSADLRAVLADSTVDVRRRLRIVEELLGGRARPVTVALVSMVVAAGRDGDLIEIIDAAVDRAAAGRNRKVARVRSAVVLSDEQQARLARAIKASSGVDVEIHATVDPSVMGGVITEIGDDVIDGSVRSRLKQMRAGIS